MPSPSVESVAVESPFGRLLVIAGPAGVVRVCYEGTDHAAALAEVADCAGEGALDPGELAGQAAAGIEGFFAGGLREISVPLDLGLVSCFQRRVLEAAAEIPFGETASYREMAIAAGSPGAVRAAGSAMAANPVPILVPCHRVVRSDGSTGLYGGGEEMKRRLLGFEAQAVAQSAAIAPA